MNRWAGHGLLLSICMVLMPGPVPAAPDPWLNRLCGLWLTDPASTPVSYEHWWWQGDSLQGEGGLWRSGQREVREHLRLVANDAAQFDYHAQPLQQPVTVFAASDEEQADARRWLNASHDFPQLIRYRLSENELTASISHQHDHALEQAHHWHYKRRQGCQTAARLP